MWTAVFASLALGAACALWVLLQRWIARTAPDLPGVERHCSGCPRKGGCERHCELDGTNPPGTLGSGHGRHQPS